MAASNSRQKINSQEQHKPEWYKNPWTRIIGAIGGATLIFSTGFSIGQFKRDIEHKLEIGNFQLKYNERLQDQINACREAKETETRNKVNDLQKVVEKLSERRETK